MTYRFVLAALCAGLLCGQTKPSPQDLLKEAVTFHQNGKLDDAIRDYQLFLDMYPDATAVRSNLGAALVAQGKYFQAIEQYKLALLNHPDPKVQLNLALAYYKTTNYQQAGVELEAVKQADPTNQQAVELLADCYLRLAQYKKTIALLTPLRAAHPDDSGIAYILGTALARDGQAAEAQQVITQLLGSDDSAEVHLLMGTTKLAINDFSGALVDLKRAVELNPKLPDAYTYYGVALFAKGDMEQSKKMFLAELEQDPHDFEANIHLGIMARQDQDYPKSSSYLQKALAVRPGDVAVRYQIALVEIAQGKEEQARDELEDIVHETPNFAEAHVSLSIIYFREKRKEDGNRERAIVQKLNEQRQAQEPGVKPQPAANAKPAGEPPSR